jgi:hypothetical protein
MKTYKGVEVKLNMIFTRWKLVVSCTLRPLYHRGNSSQYPLIRLGWPTNRPVHGGGEKYSCREWSVVICWHYGISQDLMYLLTPWLYGLSVIAILKEAHIILVFAFCRHLFIFNIRKSFSACRIWGSHSGGYKEFCLLVYNGPHGVISQTTELFILYIF